MMRDYTISYRRLVGYDDLAKEQWDTFVSAYNGSERVQHVFPQVQAANKHWLLHREYRFDQSEWPIGGRIFAPPSDNEADFIGEYLSDAETDLRAGSLCVDITGFMRPHLMLLVRMLRNIGVTSFNALYTDPVAYAHSEETTFSDGPIEEVRQVAGFEGNHVADNGTRDLLVIGAGYDHQLVQWVAESKRHAKKLLMYGLPSLQPDMYQQSRLRVARAAEAVGPAADTDLLFAPANNPFVTAQALSDAIEQERMSQRGLSNLYLSPLGTKPQVLGFALYYLTDCIGKAASILFPFARLYSRETSRGISRSWIYSIEVA
jgi:hypothetical protein